MPLSRPSSSRVVLVVAMTATLQTTLALRIVCGKSNRRAPGAPPQREKSSTLACSIACPRLLIPVFFSGLVGETYLVPVFLSTAYVLHLVFIAHCYITPTAHTLYHHCTLPHLFVPLLHSRASGITLFSMSYL
ncbi:MAG: hypothetical protein J3R72DRAFT_453448 [Linnemannia gamsii]|nr:MAG: hypothetical protein J3R72DRAFT_453448 [Linnemannia gamsii]